MSIDAINQVADLNGNIFEHIICPLSFFVIALIFPELRGGGGIPLSSPGSHKTKNSPVCIVIKAKRFVKFKHNWFSIPDFIEIG